jgi:FtsH-binding integral membrane protein
MNSSPYLNNAGSLSEESSRGRFVRRTYMHLAMAVMVFAGLEGIIVHLWGEQLFNLTMFSKWSWLAVLGLYMVVCWVAEQWANNAVSQTMQYLGLTVFVAAEALIFAPMIYMATRFAPEALPVAIIFTLIIFAALTMIVVITGKDFSFLRGFLVIAGFVALGVILASIVFGWTLGVIFSAVMVGFAMLTILFQTSRVMREYGEDQYVAASLSLFASLALLFWYVLRIAIAIYSRD